MTKAEYSKYLTKAMQWCSHTERCKTDLKQKLRQWKAPAYLYDPIADELQNENFIDENRYANAYVSDKFRFNKWGKTKIYHALKQKQIPEKFISQALQTIDDEDYIATARTLMKEKNRQIDDEYQKRKQKVFRFMATRGFETGIIFDLWDNMEV